MANLVRK